MKSIILFTGLLLSLSFTSCIRESGACLQANKTDVNVNESITFTDCSEHADHNWFLIYDSLDSLVNADHLPFGEVTDSADFSIIDENTAMTKDCSTTSSISIQFNAPGTYQVINIADNYRTKGKCATGGRVSTSWDYITITVK